MHSIWAVATNTVKQALRIKVAVVFIALLIILLPIMGTVMTGDGTLKGRLQTFVSYGLSLTSFLLSLLTIIISTYSITIDIKQKQIYTVLTKPVLRYQFIIGKLLGVIILDLTLLILFSAVIYTTVIYTPRFSGATQEEIRQAQNEFYTARAGLAPPKFDVTSEVEAAYNKLKQNAQLPQGMSHQQIIEQLTNQRKLEKQSAAVGQELVWEFFNVKPLDSKQSLFVRFKYDASIRPPDSKVFGLWDIGDIRQINTGKIETPIYRIERKDLISTFYEIEIPADAIAADGYLAVRFINVPLNNTVVIFPQEDGFEVLYKADIFTLNFIRVVLVLLLQLIFLACFGVFAATFLSFPVAILLSLAIFFTGTISGFCLDALDLQVNSSYYIVKPLIQLLPRFDKYSPADFLVPARILTWSLLGKITITMVCIRSFVLLLLAVLIFNRKEIAKIIV
jgi:hypothetical protein